MGLLEMFPLHVILVFVYAFINNVALTSPQKTRAIGPPIFQSVPKTSFSCDGRTAGYYADPEAECQAYHMCDPLGKQFSYLCPAYTLFNQKYMVCDHWHAVNCSAAIFYYDLNERIGQVPDKKNKETNDIEERPQGLRKRKKEKKDDIQKKSRAADLTNHLNNIKQTSPLQRVSKSTNPFVPIKTTTLEPVRATKLPAHFQLPQQTFQLPNKATETTADIFEPVRSTNLPDHFQQPQQTFQLPDRSKEITSGTFEAVRPTNLPAHFQQPQQTFQLPNKATENTTVRQSITTERQTTSKFTNFHTFPTTHITNIVSDITDEDTPSFLISARGSGQRFKFGSTKKKDFHDKIVNGVKFRTLFEKTKNPMVDKRNFTVAPDIFTPTPTPTTVFDDDDDDDDLDYDDENSLQGRSLTPEPIIPFLIPPSPHKQNEHPVGNRIIPSLSTFLVPPPKGPIILEGSNQEIKTPLVVSKFFRSFRILPPESEITPPKFPFSRPNREFFIPAPGLLPPLPGNSIADEHQHSNEDHHLIPHKMTMTFPTDSTMRKRRPFRINPSCPRCHPAFLKPNQCTPCVIIK